MSKLVLLLGATGLFGGHLARQLAVRDDVVLVLAGRTQTTLAPLASELGAEAVVLDRTDDSAVSNALDRLQPFAVIDCSGPFQNYGDAPYAFVEVVVTAGAHYLDIADGTEFVAGITALDPLARKTGVCVWSGASTTPALSSAIAADLVHGLDAVDLIETSIVPGNKTPRGLSVMQAILGQIGKVFTQRRGGEDHQVFGWGDSVSLAVKAQGKSLGPRLAAYVNTPDTALLTKRFKASTVIARAGLELRLFHGSLSVLRYLVARLNITTLESFSKPLLKLSNLFVHYGTDAGGMRVRVLGTQGAERVERIWDMIIPDGQGPKTPVQPTLILLSKLLAGQTEPGARPALTAFSRAEAEAQLATIEAVCERRDSVITPIFAQALETSVASLPPPVQALHDVGFIKRYKGVAEVQTATTWYGRFVAFVGGFPTRGSLSVPAEVEILADDNFEVWTRSFGEHSFKSVLRFEQAFGQTRVMTEQFGLLKFRLSLHAHSDELRFPVLAGRAFGFLPIPRFLTPVSDSSECVDAAGRFQFDVHLSMPFAGRIVHYKGYLEPTAG